MNKIKIIITLLIAFVIVLNSCNDEGTAINFGGGNIPNGIFKDFTTNEAGVLETTDNYGLRVEVQTVPLNDNEQPGNVTFSIEVPVPDADIPTVAIPSNYRLISKIAKYGPSGFVFAKPVLIWMPAKDEPTPDGLVIIKFDEQNSQWIELPVAGIDSVKRTISAMSFTLGYFALVKNTLVQNNNKLDNPLADNKGMGGIKFGAMSCPVSEVNSYHGPWFLLTIKTMTYLYPDQSSWYTNRAGTNTLICATNSTPSDPTSSFPNPPIKWWLPQGTYEIWITAYSYSVSGQFHSYYYTYSLPATVTINRPLVSQGWGDHIGWFSLTIPAGGDWIKSQSRMIPDQLPCWPTPTKTYGTGTFQATLTWTNTQSLHTDYDLHLYGPNNLHVYHGNKTPEGGFFALDRDWLNEYGNAIENIYSLKNQLPVGDYRVTVKYYSGIANNRYSIRIKRPGSMRTYSGALSTVGQEVEIERFSIR